MSNAVTFADLCGLRMLDGRGEFVLEKDADRDRYENAYVVVLRLDGQCYRFQEDPDDGYRSNLGTIERCKPDDLPPGSFVEFAPIMTAVRVRNWKSGEYADGPDDVLYGTDERTGLVLFEVGTDGHDGYYPSFVHEWWPGGFAPSWLAGVDLQTA